MADICRMTFSFIRKTTLITTSPQAREGEFFLKAFQWVVFKGFKICNRRCYVDRHRARSIDRNLFFLKVKPIISWRHWQPRMKSAMIKQRYLVNSFLVVFCFSVLLQSWMSRLNYMDVSLLLKSAAAHAQLSVSFYISIRYFLFLAIYLWELY